MGGQQTYHLNLRWGVFVKCIVAEEFVETMRAKAKADGRSLGPQAEAVARFRPLSYCELSVQSQWDVDKKLQILDWSGNWDT